MHPTRLYIAFLLWLTLGAATAQSDLTRRRIAPADWEQASKGLDYSKDLPEKAPPPSSAPSGIDWTQQTEALGILLQILAIAAAMVLIGYGIYKILHAPQNRQITRDGALITLENLEQHLDETDLTPFLQAALNAQNYALAVRLYYLQIIKNLAAGSLIRWSKEKTNRDYLHEMRAHRLSNEFRRLTANYERVWYGNQPPDAQAFADMASDCQQFLSRII
jgi:hypothetical protein